MLLLSPVTYSQDSGLADVIIIIINEKINVAFSPQTSRTSSKKTKKTVTCSPDENTNNRVEVSAV